MVQALLEEVERFDEKTRPLASFVEKENQKHQKTALPVLSSLPQTNRDILRFEIGVEAFAAQLAAHA